MMRCRSKSNRFISFVVNVNCKTPVDLNDSRLFQCDDDVKDQRTAVTSLVVVIGSFFSRLTIT